MATMCALSKHLYVRAKLEQTILFVGIKKMKIKLLTNRLSDGSETFDAVLSDENGQSFTFYLCSTSVDRAIRAANDIIDVLNRVTGCRVQWED